MGELIIIFQFTKCDMCIHLRSGKRFVSEQLFHTVDFGTVVEHSGGKTVPHHVRTFRASHPGSRQLIVHHILY